MIAAGLSFIGFGVQPPTPEWGLMINEGSSYIVSGQWWVTFFPGLAILSVVLGFFMLDHGLKEGAASISAATTRGDQRASSSDV